VVEAVRGMAYVPGIGRGALTRRARPGTILLTDQTTLLDVRARPGGCLLVNGAPFSHATIALLSRGIPTVILGADQTERLCDGIEVTIDGATGWVLPADVAAPALTPTPPPAPTPVLTQDGCHVELRASARDVTGVGQARDRGAAAVGLVRTEFLLPDGDTVPDAVFYRASFRAICEAAAPLPVTLRLLDLAPDKHPAWANALPRGNTLGRQGVRLFDHPLIRQVVLAQLEAIANLCGEFPVQILVPYLTNVEEFLRWRAMIDERLSGKAVAVGAMIETPAASMLVDRLARVADFVAIGTNDLMQCFYGADRDDPAVAAYLNPYSPALYRFLRTLAQQADHHIDRVQLCGVLSQLPGTLQVLLGLGYRAFSVDAVHLPYLATTVGEASYAACRELAAEVCAATTSGVVSRLLGVPEFIPTNANADLPLDSS